MTTTILLQVIALALAGVVRIDAIVEIDGQEVLHLTPAGCSLESTAAYTGTPRGPTLTLERVVCIDRLFDDGFEPPLRVIGGAP